jgi:hypothetical protein
VKLQANQVCKTANMNLGSIAGPLQAGSTQGKTCGVELTWTERGPDEFHYFNTKLANKNKKDNKNMELRNGCANLTCSANHNAGIKQKMVNEKRNSIL